MVERVSPVEALRLAEGEQSHRKIKKNTSVTWWGMAASKCVTKLEKGIDCYAFHRSFYGGCQLYCDAGAGI